MPRVLNPGPNKDFDCFVFVKSVHLGYSPLKNSSFNLFFLKYFLLGISGAQLKLLLNFAVGSLLGDVFLHLLPEAWNHARGKST